MASPAEWLGGELTLLPGTLQGMRVQVIVPMDYGALAAERYTGA
jgi:hypothetical protein